MVRRLPLLRDDVYCYAAAQTDRARFAARLVATRVAVALFLLSAACIVFVLAAGRLLAGIAGGLTVAMDGNGWLADLVLGAAVLVLLGGGAAVFAKRNATRRWHRLEQRYRRPAPPAPPGPAMAPGATEGNGHAE